MVTPAIRAFKKKYPDALLDVAVEPPGDSLIKLNSYVDNVVLFDQKSWLSFSRQFKIIREIRRKRYDLVVDFLGNPRSAHYTFLSGATVRVGNGNARFRYAYNKWVYINRGFSALSKLSFLEFLDVDQDDCQLEFVLDSRIETPDELDRFRDHKLIAVSPVSRRREKMWALEKYGTLVNFLYKKCNLITALIAGPGESDILEETGRFINVPFVPLYLDDIMRLGAVLRRCSLFVGNDNGPKHMAVAIGLPTFTIFGNTNDPTCWTYPDKSRHRFVGGKDEGTPIREIPIELVNSQVAKLIADLGIAEVEDTSID